MLCMQKVQGWISIIAKNGRAAGELLHGQEYMVKNTELEEHHHTVVHTVVQGNTWNSQEFPSVDVHHTHASGTPLPRCTDTHAVSTQRISWEKFSSVSLYWPTVVSVRWHPGARETHTYHLVTKFSGPDIPLKKQESIRELRSDVLLSPSAMLSSPCYRLINKTSHINESVGTFEHQGLICKHEQQIHFISQNLSRPQNKCTSFRNAVHQEGKAIYLGWSSFPPK